MRKKIVIMVLILSIILNISLGVYVYSNHKLQENKHVGILAWSDEYLSDAVNGYSISEVEWNELSDAELVSKLSEAESDLYAAMVLMSTADSYFVPLKKYWSECSLVRHNISEDGKNDENYILYLETKDALRFLWSFLAENSVLELGIDEVRDRWRALGIED